jgi:hypothetical protein
MAARKMDTAQPWSAPHLGGVIKLSFFHHADWQGLSHSAVSKRPASFVPPILVSANLQGAFCK